jgi:hypothetical protein
MSSYLSSMLSSRAKQLRGEIRVYRPAHCNQAVAVMYVSIPDRVLDFLRFLKKSWKTRCLAQHSVQYLAFNLV